jgi:hypothetical protein
MFPWKKASTFGPSSGSKAYMSGREGSSEECRCSTILTTFFVDQQDAKRFSGSREVKGNVSYNWSVQTLEGGKSCNVGQWVESVPMWERKVGAACTLTRRTSSPLFAVDSCIQFPFLSCPPCSRLRHSQREPRCMMIIGTALAASATSTCKSKAALAARATLHANHRHGTSLRVPDFNLGGTDYKSGTRCQETFLSW